ncbi:serine hydrolase [Bacteroides sedimenti]|uniref:Beta-lactamase class A catalytic domain-containing protein n=1 Tax=Bacteroides sedimenti TaxID=2136147 RepID=A0ABM8I8W1_9BACE
MAKDVFFKPYLDNPEKYEIQIIYTQIDRNSQNNPNFTQYDYRLDNRQFFNPASLVKWPLILLGMENVNNLNEKFGVSIYNKIGFSSASRKRHSGSVDRLAPDKKSRLVNYIKEMILVSDNNAYNRMYDFLGQGYINNRLTEMGYDSLRILHRFDDCTVEQNRTTPSVSFYNKKGVLIYKQPSTTNPIQLSNPLGEIVKGGKDYSYFNNAPLQNINDMMLYVFFKESVPQQKRFNLTESDYRLLYKYTAMHPAESEFYVFKKKKKRYPVHLKKYLYYGKDSSKPNIPGLRIHNMVGESHGTLSDVAYFVNPSTGVEFMLSAVINTCDGDITPANYHYKDVGFPFLERLGEMIYQYELHRK